MSTTRILLFPISALYWLITWLRNIFFDIGILPSKTYGTTLISVGNLKVGGTGKTPHVEYLLGLLKGRFTIAVLSRGFGRVTKGPIWADAKSTSLSIGDEPYQIFSKFKDVPFLVDGNRRRGIKLIEEKIEGIKAVILDDAFQHRYVTPGLNILLTEYSDLYINDYIMPSGNLRESKIGANRADLIVVTKTPEIFSPQERRIILKEINPKPYQQVFFSFQKYGSFINLKEYDTIQNKISKEYYFSRGYSCVLVTGIANSSNLFYYLKENLKNVTHLSYKDHHRYAEADVKKIKSTFDNMSAENKFIITTEKDAGRLLSENLRDLTLNLPIFFISYETAFHEADSDLFNEQINNYVGRN